MKTLEEELDFSKKANRVKIERLLQRAHQAKKVWDHISMPSNNMECVWCVVWCGVVCACVCVLSTAYNIAFYMGFG